MATPTEGVVVIPIACAKCGEAIRIECERSIGTGHMSFSRFDCPHCGKPNHREFPGSIVRVAKATSEVVVVRVTRPDGAQVDDTAIGKPDGDWTAADAKGFARKLRNLIEAPSGEAWNWTLEAEDDDEYQRFVVTCAGWTARSNPVRLGDQVASSLPATWRGDPSWRRPA